MKVLANFCLAKINLTVWKNIFLRPKFWCSKSPICQTLFWMVAAIAICLLPQAGPALYAGKCSDYRHVVTVVNYLSQWASCLVIIASNHLISYILKRRHMSCGVGSVHFDGWLQWRKQFIGCIPNPWPSRTGRLGYITHLFTLTHLYRCHTETYLCFKGDFSCEIISVLILYF